MDATEVRNLIERAREVSRSLAMRVPGAPIYPLVLDELDVIESALGVGPRGAFEASRPLGVLAVRELDESSCPDIGSELPEAAELRDIILRVRDGLRRIAGLPSWA